MTSAQIVETSVTHNSSFQNYSHPDDHTIQTDIPFFSIYFTTQLQTKPQTLHTIHLRDLRTKTKIQYLSIQLRWLHFRLFVCLFFFFRNKKDILIHLNTIIHTDIPGFKPFTIFLSLRNQINKYKSQTFKTHILTAFTLKFYFLEKC